ncbi:Sortase family protein [Corynebacterium faecale]|uniref:class C sortase n=1 Tax=Corynebacterium faecale TaxID=1758466 RepID=UPI0025B39114|nr:class C sortase [Corynebacterium faecale]WJY93045.1 Sortase family protein [Corynebacterium faecale]
MSILVAEVPQPAGRHRLVAKPKRTKKQKQRLASNILLQILAMFGIGLLIYPDGADWVNSLGHNSEISGYVREVENTNPEERQRILDAAYAYNDQLEPGPLTDPYLTESEDAALGSDVYRAYEEMLRVSGTDAVGTLMYSDVEIALPIYHGTSDEVIGKGIGHLYGTSLPVGGPSTRSVLTAHSGLPHAKLFTTLHNAEVGDTFWISVLGEDHHYQVRGLETVLPNETDSFEIIEGEDWVTLFTCTPVGVNSHRLLAHAQRIPSPEEDTDRVIAGDGLTAGFPWWLVIFIGGSALVALMLFMPGRKKKSKKETE